MEIQDLLISKSSFNLIELRKIKVELQNLMTAVGRAVSLSSSNTIYRWPTISVRRALAGGFGRMREDRDRPLRSLVVSAEQDVRTKFAWLCAGMRHHAQEMHNNVGRVVQEMGQHIASQQRQQRGSLSRLAVCSVRQQPSTC